jgi:RND family efflux transporter MFP subunit
MKITVVIALIVLAFSSAIIATEMWISSPPKMADSTSQTSPSVENHKDKKIAYWWDPMLGPSSISDHPGKSAMNMDLVPKYEEDVSSGPSVQIDPAVVQNMGVVTASVIRGPLNVTVRATAMLEVPQPGLHDVTLRIDGYIEKLYADTEGMGVTKGDVLFDLYSPQLQVEEQNLINGHQRLNSSGSQSSETAHQDAQRFVDSTRQRLINWNVAEADIDAILAAGKIPKTTPIRSPADGHMVDKMIVEGSSVQAGMKAMRIEDHTKLWLDAQVYEDQISVIQVGQVVHATVDGVSGKTFDGQVSFIYPHMDHMLRSAIVRTVLDNPAHEMRPGMYAAIEIVTQPVPDAVLVPREAIIDTGAQQIAFVTDPNSPGHFEPRKVRLGIVGDDDKVQIVEGLAPGDQVVTSGQFLLDVESRTNEAIAKLRGLSDKSSNAAASAGAVSANLASTIPSTVPSERIAIVHCSMQNVDWLQVGDAISNPYLGLSMPTCGEITGHLPMPQEGARLSSIFTAYLKVIHGLQKDSLDHAAVAELKKQSDSAGSESSDALRTAVDHLAGAADLDSARKAVAQVGSALSTQLKTHTK